MGKLIKSYVLELLLISDRW